MGANAFIDIQYVYIITAALLPLCSSITQVLHSIGHLYFWRTLLLLRFNPNSVIFFFYLISLQVTICKLSPNDTAHGSGSHWSASGLLPWRRVFDSRPLLSLPSTCQLSWTNWGCWLGKCQRQPVPVRSQAKEGALTGKRGWCFTSEPGATSHYDKGQLHPLTRCC